MLITIKTLKQETFKVEVDENEKVLAIKEKVQEAQGHPVSTQKLIFSGKILTDEDPISKYDIKEKDFLVIMVTKAKAPAAAPKPAAASTSEPTVSSAPPPAPVTQTVVEQPAAAAISPVVAEIPTAPASTEPAPVSDDQASAETVETAETADSALVTGANFETAIQNMMELGYPREQCMLAMRASFNNPDRAAEYLMNGIPEHLLAQPSAPAPARAAPPTSAAAPAAASPAPTNPTAAAPAVASAGAASAGVASAGAAAPQNLFTAAAQAAANARRGTQGEAGAGDIENLAFLRDQPQFQQIRDMVQSNPELLQPLLFQLGQSNPQMLQLINQNQQAFLQLLNEGYEDPQEGGNPDQLPPGVNAIYVTQEEREAIQRLESLGFEHRAVVEAFIACDRDEQLAANYLFENRDDYDDDAQ
ncbi:MAG: UV excision repair protein RAD23 [Benniella sp.]|nr:MAG: UV excision repair protein RAD23 [Benniella sp.]